MSRYDTHENLENAYEPGSNDRVLKNMLGITDKRSMDKAETQAYLSALNRIVDTYDREHRFISEDLCAMHHLWLGDIYAWAGKYRTVNISKGDFPFAMARQIPSLMETLEKGPLAEFTPCLFEEKEDLIHALSAVHAELVLIHPFREGNG